MLWQREIRNFLKVRTSYDVLPLSFRLIVFDTSLSVKESLNILTQNGKLHCGRGLHHRSGTAWNMSANDNRRNFTGIVSAPLWDSTTSTFAGLLTTSDYINVIQYYFQHPAALAKIDQFRLNSLRGVLFCFSAGLQFSFLHMLTGRNRS